MEKNKSALSNPLFKQEQEKIVSICINALQIIYSEIIQKRQINYFKVT